MLLFTFFYECLLVPQTMEFEIVMSPLVCKGHSFVAEQGGDVAKPFAGSSEELDRIGCRVEVLLVHPDYKRGRRCADNNLHLIIVGELEGEASAASILASMSF